MEEIKMFSGWFHHVRHAPGEISTAQANQMAVEETNEWMRTHPGVEIVHRATHISADYLTITIWSRPIG